MQASADLQPYVLQIDELMAELKRGFEYKGQWTSLTAKRHRTWLDKLDAFRREIVLQAEIAFLKERISKLQTG